MPGRCKYLYLLFDDQALARADIHNFIFSTEGHVLPVLPQWHRPMAHTVRAPDVGKHQVRRKG